MSVPVLPHRRDLRRGGLVFPEEIHRIGRTLEFQFDCVSDQIQRELFGPELDTGRIGDWLDLYAAYDMALQDVVDLENVKTKIEGLQETATGTDAETLTKQMEAVEKALTLAKDKCQKMFESGITTFQGYLDDANLCVTNCGTRSSKLELIENRMKSQNTTLETLKMANENSDGTETVINLKSEEMTYEAALMATGKVMQTTLLNFI